MSRPVTASSVRSVCVFCSSSSAVPHVFFEAADELGAELARRDLTLVYGGATVGLMGAVASEVRRNGGRVVGVIPGFMREREIANKDADELVVTGTMRERKEAMEQRADAFIAMPGGFGTLEEILEIITLRLLGRHQKPIVFLDTAGFYRPLLALFEELYEARFAKPESRDFYRVALTPAEALDHIVGHAPSVAPTKWL